MEFDCHLHQSSTKWHVLVVDFLSNRPRRIANNILQWVILCQLIDKGEPARSTALGAATAAETGETSRSGSLNMSPNTKGRSVRPAFENKHKWRAWTTGSLIVVGVQLVRRNNNRLHRGTTLV
nr:hypothetical protein [Tanacetum cinerariifolium]